MAQQLIDGPPTVPMRIALGAVTANALVIGTAGVSAPMAWLLLPGMMVTLSRPRAAAVVALWGVLLIGASVLVPVIPGHDADPWALGTSVVCLVVLPAMAWVRIRGHVRQVHEAYRRTPRVISLVAGFNARCAALAHAGLSTEVAVAVHRPDGTVRILVGLIAGEVSTPERLRDCLEHLFEDLSRSTSDLQQVAAVLDARVRRSAHQGYVTATLVEIGGEGAARVLRCGSPQPLAGYRADGPEASTWGAGSGIGNPPLGLGHGVWQVADELPDRFRVAVLTSGYAIAHYDDYLSAAEEALRLPSLEHAAGLLMRGPARPSSTVANLEVAPVVGPALVIGPRRHPG